MKVFTALQVRNIDNETIVNEPVSSIDLMERAASCLCSRLLQLYTTTRPFIVFCGRGNNGGDGLVLARLLLQHNYDCCVYICAGENQLSPDAAINFNRLKDAYPQSIHLIANIGKSIEIPGNAVVIDALFGSGLTRPVQDIEAHIIDIVNSSLAEVVSVDIPSGLFAEDNSGNVGAIVKAKRTFTFEAPFLSFFFDENYQYTGNWEIMNIKLLEEAKQNTDTPYNWVQKCEVKALYKQRIRVAHKGNYGHALLIAGSKGKTGAAVLAARACLRTGCGLLTVRVPGSSYDILQISCPEAMTTCDTNSDMVSSHGDISKYEAIGIGPGLGTHTHTAAMIFDLLQQSRKPMVLDADALNILAANRDLLANLPPNTILTPHPGEFKRLFGETNNSYEALQMQIEASKKYNIIIVRKGAFTACSLPDGSCYFNSTGNQGMATAGAGDVLTGMILSLLAQNYEPGHAAILGMWLHGKAGDIACEKQSYESLIAGDIVDSIGKAYNVLLSEN
ncbi:MAG TPA: NAD(P)H-hydrate dehydratase [Bacteroidales bacterium]|nr:NAD(P)H-hydrate dehydratase [Bacteroidales bacterium]